jgi:hypothetical protein
LTDEEVMRVQNLIADGWPASAARAEVLAEETAQR